MRIKQIALAIFSVSVTGSALACASWPRVAATCRPTSPASRRTCAGTANAGRASNAQDASVVYNNPAAMHLLKQAQFTQAVAFIDAQTKIKNATGGIGGTNEGDIVPHTFIPSGYFTSGDKGGWAWGVAAYGSYGLKTNHEATYAARYLGDKSSVKVTTIQPTISYKVNDKVSVGFGPTINKVDALLTKNVAAFTGGAIANTELKGDDYGYGYNLGIHAVLDENTSAGVVYRSKVKYKIDDGTLTTTGIAAPGTYNAKTSLTTPESVELAVSHKLNAKDTIHAGAAWTRWSRFKELSVQTTHPVVGTTVETFNWKDSVGYSVGMTHAVCDKLELRAGLAYDNSPVAPADRGVRLPSADRRIASIGAGYKLSPSQTIDASYTYVDEETAEVRTPAYSADFHNRASVYGLQFTQKF